MAVFYADSAGSQGTGDGSTAGNACTLAEFINNDAGLYQALAAGDICYCKNGTTISYDGSTGVYATLAVTGSTTLPISIIGYNTTITDGGVVELSDSDNGATNNPLDFNSMDYWHFYNLKFTNIRRLQTGTTNGHLLYNIEIDNPTVSGLEIGAGTGDLITVLDCSIHSSGSFGFEIEHRASKISNCESYDNTGAGIVIGNGAYGAFVDRCLCYNNGGNGITLTGEASLLSCLCDDNTGSGYYVDADTHTTFVNCGATNNGTYGITGDANSNAFIQNCGFYLNTSGNINTTNVTVLQNISQQTTDPLFTDQPNRDYTLQSSSPWIDAGEGYGGDWNIGVAQSTPSGGSGGLLMSNKRGNKQ